MSRPTAVGLDYLPTNYHPLDVVITSGAGCWLTDVTGRSYLDFLSAYSAANFGHRNPVLIAALWQQLERITLVSRAFRCDRLEEFAQKLATATGKDLILPMNTGVEAVESAIKVARKWGYQRKGVPTDQAEIIVMAGNFHGRTTTVVSFSDDEVARTDFGPFTPGFVQVPYNDVAALAAAITDRTVAVLLEPIQGEAGVVIPDDGYLRAVSNLTTEHGILMIADEIQSGLGRVGTTFAVDYEQVVPDMLLLGKALGGGLLPLSAVAANREVLGVLKPGEHGSTFGGNPLACAVGSAVVDLLGTGEYQRRAQCLGGLLREMLDQLIGRGVLRIRSRGLWAGIDIDPTLGSARDVCEGLAAQGILAKDTHGSTIRFSPPIPVTEAELAQAVDALATVLADLARRPASGRSVT